MNSSPRFARIRCSVIDPPEKHEVKKTTVKTTKPKTPKSVLKAMTAARKKAGKAAKSAAAKKNVAAMKKKGVGIFAPKTLSSELAAICGGKSMARTEVTKKIWAYTDQIS